MAQEIQKTKTASNVPVERKQVRAHARYIQVSPQKMRLVADMVRNTPVDLALEQLRFSSKKASLPMIKVINSAVANAVHNFNLNKDDLFIKALSVDGGPVLKRFRPRAQGRAGAIHKRSSHINVVLEERKQARKKTSRSIFAGVRPGKSARVEAHSHDHEHEDSSGKVEGPKSGPKQAPPKPDEKQKSQRISLKRRLFNRKSGE
jgi:large subunit ribosomal protein L22